MFWFVHETDMLTDWDKEYIATLRLGVSTDTQDLSGRVLFKADKAQLAALTKERVEESVLHFLGGYEQIPPMYSALKVNGKKLYELARAGKEVERRPRSVTNWRFWKWRFPKCVSAQSAPREPI